MTICGNDHCLARGKQVDINLWLTRNKETQDKILWTAKNYFGFIWSLLSWQGTGCCFSENPTESHFVSLLWLFLNEGLGYVCLMVQRDSYQIQCIYSQISNRCCLICQTKIRNGTGYYTGQGWVENWSQLGISTISYRFWLRYVVGLWVSLCQIVVK